MARRTLAASVVVTVSLGELVLGGCNRPPTIPPIDNPPPPDDGGVMDDGGGTTTAQTKIHKLDDGTCIEVIDVECPEGATCNPPPPQKVPCPDEPAGGV